MRQARGKRFEFSPARSPLPSASGGLWALGCVGERRRSVRRCRLGTRVRVSVPGGGVEAVAVAPWRNKSSRTLPRPVGASLRRRRRARGGKSPFVESLFKSPSAGARCLRGATGRRLLFPRCGVGCWFCGRWEVGSSSFPSRRSVAAASSGPRSRVLGAWPQLMDFSATALSRSQGRVSSAAWTSVFCSFLQSVRAMEYSSIWIWAAAVGSSVPRRRERCSLGLQGVQGPRSNIFLLKALCASTVVLLYSVFLYGLPVSVLVFVYFS